MRPRLKHTTHLPFRAELVVGEKRERFVFVESDVRWMEVKLHFLNGDDVVTRSEHHLVCYVYKHRLQQAKHRKVNLMYIRIRHILDLAYSCYFLTHCNFRNILAI